MPNGDGTGPDRKGSQTGRAQGRCSGNDEPGWKSTAPRRHIFRNQITEHEYRGKGNGFRRGRGGRFGCRFD